VPVLKVSLDLEGQSGQTLSDFMCRATEGFANILDCPKERIRVFLIDIPKDRYSVGGIPGSEGGPNAPFFEFYLLKGRSGDQAAHLFRLFTELLADCFDAQRELVRGRCVYVPPQDWCIGGHSAADIRAAEVAARADAQNS